MTAVYARFQHSQDKYPEHIEGPFEYIQTHHGIMEATDMNGNFIIDFAGRNEDGTWNAGPVSLTSDGYTDVVIYAGEN